MTETVQQINKDLEPRSYPQNNCAAFRRSRDAHGDLSNMTWGFALTVNKLRFQGPEGLYQALKYPDRPEIQRQIAGARSGMDAKRTAYEHSHQLAQWNSIRINAMAFTLAVKLNQHPGRFGRALAETARLDVVENSLRDPFWGAKPANGALNGVNVLGRLLTALRDHLQDAGDARQAAERLLHEVDLAGLDVNGAPVALQ